MFCCSLDMVSGWSFTLVSLILTWLISIQSHKSSFSVNLKCISDWKEWFAVNSIHSCQKLLYDVIDMDASFISHRPYFLYLMKSAILPLLERCHEAFSINMFRQFQFSWAISGWCCDARMLMEAEDCMLHLHVSWVFCATNQKLCLDLKFSCPLMSSLFSLHIIMINDHILCVLFSRQYF